MGRDHGTRLSILWIHLHPVQPRFHAARNAAFGLVASALSPGEARVKSVGSWRARPYGRADGDRVAGLAIVNGDLGMRMFVFELFGGLDRDGLVVAVRAWLAVNGDLIPGAGHSPQASSRPRRTAGASGFLILS
jgi:hypothetical protein